MILLHDAGGDTREETVKALPEIIHFFKKNGYKFTTIADVLGKTKADLMPVAKEENSSFWGKYYDVVVVGFFWATSLFSTCSYQLYFWLWAALS
jgi:hypothetical protein